jgi:hypothetical protein
MFINGAMNMATDKTYTAISQYERGTVTAWGLNGGNVAFTATGAMVRVDCGWEMVDEDVAIDEVAAGALVHVKVRAAAKAEADNAARIAREAEAVERARRDAAWSAWYNAPAQVEARRRDDAELIRLCRALLALSRA